MPARYPQLIATGLVAAVMLAASSAKAQGPHTAVAQSSQHGAPLFRHMDVDTAWKASQKSGRPMMVFVTSKQCHFCDKMIKETWSHPQIAQAVAHGFEPVALLKESNPKLVRDLGVRAYPTTIVISPEGKLAGHIRGFADPQKFATALLVPKKDNLDVKTASYGGSRK